MHRHFEDLCIPQKNLSNKHFQQFLNKIMKEKEKEDLGQRVLKAVLLRLGNFTFISEKRISWQVCLIFIYTLKIGCTFQKKTCYLLFKACWLGLCFHIKQLSNRAQRDKDRTWSCGGSYDLVRGAPCSSLNLVFRRKLRADFIFAIPYSASEIKLYICKLHVVNNFLRHLTMEINNFMYIPSD